MRQMIAAAPEDRTARARARDSHKRGVEDHQSDKQSPDHHTARTKVVAVDRAHRGGSHQQAQRKTSSIPHEHTRRVCKIARQEPHAGSSGGEAERSYSEMAREERQRTCTHRRNCCHSRCGPVHVVHQVERIHKPDQPEHADERIRWSIAKHVPAQTARGDHNSYRDFRTKSQRDREAEPVVESPYHPDDGNTRNHGPVAPWNRAEHRPSKNSNHDRAAAKVWSRIAVPLVASRTVHETRSHSHLHRGWSQKISREPGKRKSERGMHITQGPR